MTMYYNKKRHIELLKCYEDLKNQGKTLFVENPKKMPKLDKYATAVEKQVIWTYREEFSR